jgi:hypothetical protein
MIAMEKYEIFHFRAMIEIIFILLIFWNIKRANNDTKPDNQSDSEGETEEGDYTVYECPGLAPVRLIVFFLLNIEIKIWMVYIFKKN